MRVVTCAVKVARYLHTQTHICIANVGVILLHTSKKKQFEGIQYKESPSSCEPFVLRRICSPHCCMGTSEIGLSADKTVT